MKTIKFLKSFLVLFLIAVSAIALTACNATEKTAVEEKATATYITYRINPEVGILVNEDGEVTDTIALNDDADTLLADVELEGKTVEEASEIIVSEAIATGFLDPSDPEKTVYVDVTTVEDNNDHKIVDPNSYKIPQEDPENPNDEDPNANGSGKKILEKVKNSISKFFEENEVLAKIESEDLTEYNDLATELNITDKKAKLVTITADLNPDMNVYELAELTDSELLTLCHKAANGSVNHKLNEEFKQKVGDIRDDDPELQAILEQIAEIKVQITALEDEILALYEDLERVKNDLLTITDEEEIQLYLTKIDEIKEAITAKENLRNELFEQLEVLRDQYNNAYHITRETMKDDVKKIKEEIKAEEKNERALDKANKEACKKNVEEKNKGNDKDKE